MSIQNYTQISCRKYTVCSGSTSIDTCLIQQGKIEEIKLVCNCIKFVTKIICPHCLNSIIYHTVSFNSCKTDTVYCPTCHMVARQSGEIIKPIEPKRTFNWFKFLIKKELKHSNGLLCPKCSMDSIFFQFEISETKVHCSYCGELKIKLEVPSSEAL